jgi:hypothetical protein
VRAAGGGVGPVTALANEVLAMSGRKAVLAVAAGLVLAGGAGTGVGVLNAQNSGSTAGVRPPFAKADAAQPPQQAADQKRDEASREQTARRKRLEQTLRDLDEKIRARRDSIERQQRLAGVGADVTITAALLAGVSADLTRLSADIYTEESIIRTLGITIQKLRKNLAEVDSVQIDRAELRSIAGSDPLVQDRQREVAAIERRLTAALETNEPDSPMIARLRDQLKVAEGSLAQALSAQRPSAEKAARSALKRKLETELRTSSDQLDTRIKLLEQLKVLRIAKEQDMRALNQAALVVKGEDDDLKPLLAQRAMVADALIRLDVDLRLGEPLVTPSGDKLDTILAELRELRRLVEAKK